MNTTPERQHVASAAAASGDRTAEPVRPEPPLVAPAPAGPCVSVSSPSTAELVHGRIGTSVARFAPWPFHDPATAGIAAVDVNSVGETLLAFFAALASYSQTVVAEVDRRAAAATEQVEKAQTCQEFGAAVLALITEGGYTLGSLAKHVKNLNDHHAANISGLAKSTLSHVTRGHRLFQDPDQIRHLVQLCHAEKDHEVWVEAWHRVKQRREQPDLPQQHEASLCVSALDRTGTGDDTGNQHATVNWLPGPDDEVLFQITRGQLRATVMSMVVLGVIASTTDSPGIRAAGLTALTTLTAAAGLIAGHHGLSSTAA